MGILKTDHRTQIQGDRSICLVRASWKNCTTILVMFLSRWRKWSCCSLFGCWCREGCSTVLCRGDFYLFPGSKRPSIGEAERNSDNCACGKTEVISEDGDLQEKEKCFVCLGNIGSPVRDIVVSSCWNKSRHPMLSFFKYKCHTFCILGKWYLGRKHLCPFIFLFPKEAI